MAKSMPWHPQYRPYRLSPPIRLSAMATSRPCWRAMTTRMASGMRSAIRLKNSRVRRSIQPGRPARASSSAVSVKLICAPDSPPLPRYSGMACNSNRPSLGSAANRRGPLTGLNGTAPSSLG
ncbi:hypothetical protein WR25_10533 [Diploscapter pachys]|uniref:Uncharacterized protein n=1 Tax=Diploscapter pachys TaxID=2018661 RepID=A0A2A2K7H0_9BILA|nr:hypothetical protein WR25_10533 [Diploscapter pachys]